MTPSVQTDAPWTKYAGAAELWRIDEVEEDEPTFDAQLTRTENAMSTLARQERTICVLLPNKDQLDIAVGVSVYMWASLICPHYPEWHFGCTTLSLVPFVMQISFFVFVHLLTAQVHWARCLQPRGWASGNQRAALLWPHNGKRWADGLATPPQPLIFWGRITISLEMSPSPNPRCVLTARSTSALLFLLLPPPPPPPTHWNASLVLCGSPLEQAAFCFLSVSLQQSHRAAFLQY